MPIFKPNLSIIDQDLLNNQPDDSVLGVFITDTGNSKSVLNFIGGETNGIQRVQDYIWKKDLLKNYKETRNEMLGGDYSSKFSAWLALGCISPRYIAKEIRNYEKSRVKNDSTYWLIFELIWRDFFIFHSL